MPDAPSKIPTQERIVFAHNFEGLFLRALPGRVTPALREALAGEGVDLHRLAPGYPVETWVRCLRHAATALHGDLPRPRAHRELGREFARGYFETMLGRALLGMLKVVGPERTFKRMTQNFRTANNFAEVRSEVLGPGHARMWLNHVVCEDPGFIQGLLEEGLGRVAGGPVTIEYSDFDGTAATFTARWGTAAGASKAAAGPET